MCSELVLHVVEEGSFFASRILIQHFVINIRKKVSNKVEVLVSLESMERNCITSLGVKRPYSEDMIE